MKRLSLSICVAFASLHLAAADDHVLGAARDLLHHRNAAASDADFADLVADEAFAAAAREAGITHLGGPMLGQFTEDGATVWLRTLGPADEVVVTVTVDGKERRFGPVPSRAEDDFSVRIPVRGLPPEEATPYRVEVDGEPIAMPEGAAIRPVGGESVTRIMFGGCANNGAGSDHVWRAVRAREPHALLMLGDNVYHDKGQHRGHQRWCYFEREQSRAWRELTASTGIYAIWDDHDYLGPDAKGLHPRSPLTQTDRERTYEVFRHTWNNPAYGFHARGGFGVHFATRIGAVDLIMLDNRWFVAHDKKAEHRFLGPEQTDWLYERLRAATAPFIILACGTMWTDHISGGKDSWGSIDPAGREALFRFIERERIPGVLLISSDRHMSIGYRIPRPSGHTFYEFESASWHDHSRHRREPNERQRRAEAERLRHPDLLYYDTFPKGGCSGEFTIDPRPDDPTVTFRLVDDDGSIVTELTLTRAQLTPPE